MCFFGRFLYPLELSLKEKIEVICKEMYGADGVEYSEQAEQRIQVSVSTTLDISVAGIYYRIHNIQMYGK